MSIPPWKQAIFDRKEKRKEEEKRKAAETEQRRLDALPPWKRVIEERNVIIVSADKTTSDVDVKTSGRHLTDEKHKASNKVHISTGNDEDLEKGKGVDGVSEEHCCMSVGDNLFLKLDRTRPRRRDRKQNSNSINGDIVIQSQSKTRPNSHFISGVNILDSVPVQLNTKSTATSKETEIPKQAEYVFNESNVGLRKVPDENNESVDENDAADRKQLSVSELLGRFKSSSQENLLDILPRESRTWRSQSPRAPRSKSLDRNIAKRMDNSATTTATSLKSAGKFSTPSSSHNSTITATSLKSAGKYSTPSSSHNSKRVVESKLNTTKNDVSTSKTHKIGKKESGRPHGGIGPVTKTVTIMPNSDDINDDMQKRKKKNKPDLSASELIDLGEDVPLSPTSTLSPFNFQIIESAHIQPSMEDEERKRAPSIYSVGNRDIKEKAAPNMYSDVVPPNRYKKRSDVSKTDRGSNKSGTSTNKLNERSKKATDYVGTKSSKSSGSNVKLKLPPSSMLPKHNNVEEDSPIPPPRNKKKRKAPKLDDVLKKTAQVEDVVVKQSGSSSLKSETNEHHKNTSISAENNRKMQSSNNVKVISAKEKTEHDRGKRENKTSESRVSDLSEKTPNQNNVSLLNENRLIDEEQLPVSNIDDIVLSPVKQNSDDKTDEIVNKIDENKPGDGPVRQGDSEEKKKGIIKKITSVEFIGENESSGKPSILKNIDDGSGKKIKKSVKFAHKLSATFEYASEVSANQFFDEIESVDDSETQTTVQDPDTKLTDNSTDINEDDEVEDKSVEGGLKSNTSIGNKGLQGYVPSYLQNAYMSTIERRRSQDAPQPSPTKEVIEDEQIEAVPEPNSDLFSGWSNGGNTAMLF